MALEVVSLIDECTHGGMAVDHYWNPILQSVHQQAAGAAQQIHYHPLDIAPPANYQGATALDPARRRQLTALYGQAVDDHVNANGNPQPHVLLWRGHGALVNHVTDAFLEDNRGNLPPTAWAQTARLYYAHTAMGIGPPVPALNNQRRKALISGKDIADATSFPVMPSVLWFSTSCFGAWEVSFARHVIQRGCPYYIGSRRSWIGDQSMTFLRRLCEEWQQSNFDPAQLEAAFRTVAPNHRPACPVLYRRTKPNSLNDYKMIHSAPANAYKFGKVELTLSAGHGVVVETL